MRDLPAPIPVEQALDPSRISIAVPDGESLTVGPFEARYFEAFRLAEVSTFADLQRLGLVPQAITEHEALSALLADDRAYRELAVQGASSIRAHKRCACGGEDSARATSLTRSMMQSRLIEALQPLSPAFLEPRNPSVRHTYHHLRSWFSRPGRMLVGLFALKDITIGDRATLIMTPTVRAVYANDITIGKFGTLRFTSGAVHVRANTLNGPRILSTPDTVLQTAKHVMGLSREARRIET